MLLNIYTNNTQQLYSYKNKIRIYFSSLKSLTQNHVHPESTQISRVAVHTRFQTFWGSDKRLLLEHLKQLSLHFKLNSVSHPSIHLLPPFASLNKSSHPSPKPPTPPFYQCFGKPRNVLFYRGANTNRFLVDGGIVGIARVSQKVLLQQLQRQTACRCRRHCMGAQYLSEHGDGLKLKNLLKNVIDPYFSTLLHASVAKIVLLCVCITLE